MDNRTRLLNILDFKSVDRIPNLEGGIYPQLVPKWIKEGMPEDALRLKVENINKKERDDAMFDETFLFWDKEVPFFNLDHIEFTRINTYVPEPAFKDKILEEDNRIIVYKDSCGVTHKALKEGTVSNLRLSMDQYIDFPVKDRSSFLEIKKRFTSTERRYPSNWKEKCIEWKDRKDPLSLLYIGEFGYYSMLRRWMGTEGASYIFYDDTKLVEEIFEFLTDYIIELIDKALKDSTYDMFHIFEDMAYNSGPLISPELVRKFILPQYKRLINHLHKHDIKHVWIDCDGKIDKLIPIWIEAGITCAIPCEVNAESDPITLRKKYGNEIALIGGIEKKVLTQSKKDIEEEVKKVMDYMLPRGGFIPALDHLALPDTPYENYLYYMELKTKYLKGEI